MVAVYILAAFVLHSQQHLVETHFSPLIDISAGNATSFAVVAADAERMPSKREAKTSSFEDDTQDISIEVDVTERKQKRSRRKHESTVCTMVEDDPLSVVKLKSSSNSEVVVSKFISGSLLKNLVKFVKMMA